jgi:hypothetical protein
MWEPPVHIPVGVPRPHTCGSPPFTYLWESPVHIPAGVPRSHTCGSPPFTYLWESLVHIPVGVPRPHTCGSPPFTYLWESPVHSLTAPRVLGVRPQLIGVKYHHVLSTEPLSLVDDDVECREVQTDSIFLVADLGRRVPHHDEGSVGEQRETGPRVDVCHAGPHTCTHHAE